MAYGTVNADLITTSAAQSLGAGNATNFKNRIIAPLHSRCPPIDFAISRGLARVEAGANNSYAAQGAVGGALIDNILAALRGERPPSPVNSPVAPRGHE